MASTELLALLARGASRASRSGYALRSALAGLRTGRLEVCAPDGQRYIFEGAAPGPSAQIELRSWDGADELLHLNTGCARAYLNGCWDSADLVALLTLAELNYEIFCAPGHARWWNALTLQARACMASGMRANVHARYRLENEFYRQWLDPSLTYSAALFDGDFTRSIEQAQTAKFERILQALRPRPGQSLLDIGCGWGGFARHAAANYGCRVHAVTVSRRQMEWARQRVEQAGLQQLVEVELRDFRDLRERYDHVVSIEAYEGVGEALWPAYFETIARCLKDAGTAFVQAGVVAHARFERHLSDPDFIRLHIHPTARLASWPVLEAHARRAGLAVSSTVVSSEDYAHTLKCWRERFNAAWPQPAQPALDRRFQRLWNFYLAYCEAGYRAGRTTLMQGWLEHRS